MQPPNLGHDILPKGRTVFFTCANQQLSRSKSKRHAPALLCPTHPGSNVLETDARLSRRALVLYHTGAADFATDDTKGVADEQAVERRVTTQMRPNTRGWLNESAEGLLSLLGRILRKELD